MRPAPLPGVFNIRAHAGVIRWFVVRMYTLQLRLQAMILSFALTSGRSISTQSLALSRSRVESDMSPVVLRSLVPLSGDSVQKRACILVRASLWSHCFAGMSAGAFNDTTLSHVAYHIGTLSTDLVNEILGRGSVPLASIDKLHTCAPFKASWDQQA